MSAFDPMRTSRMIVFSSGCVRPLLADRHPARRRPNPAGSAASAAAAAAAAATASAAPNCTASAASHCTASAASRRATSHRATSAAAASAPGRQLNALAKLGSSAIFLVEDVERRQADVRDFLFTENNYGTRFAALRRYVRCRRSCRCAAHCQRRPGGSQYR